MRRLLGLSATILLLVACSSSPSTGPTLSEPVLTENEAIASVHSWLSARLWDYADCLYFHQTILNGIFSAEYLGDQVWSVEHAGNAYVKLEDTLTKTEPGPSFLASWEVYEKTLIVIPVDRATVHTAFNDAVRC